MLLKAIEYAHNRGVDIINCSWDGFINNEKLKNVMKKYDDILFICSTGKSGCDVDVKPVYPACFNLPNIISVAAVDNKGNLYKYSGYGKSVNVAAPGVDILSSMPDGDYNYSSGTSSATAFVSGIAALIKSLRPDLSSVQIANIIKESVTPLPALKGKIQSEGIVNASLCIKNAEQIS